MLSTIAPDYAFYARFVQAVFNQLAKNNTQAAIFRCQDALTEKYIDLL